MSKELSKLLRNNLPDLELDKNVEKNTLLNNIRLIKDKESRIEFYDHMEIIEKVKKFLSFFEVENKNVSELISY